MEKRMYYVVCGYCGRLIKTEGNQKYGYNDRVVPVYCTEEELDIIAPAIGKGYLADSLIVEEKENYNRYEKPYCVYWDCM